MTYSVAAVDLDPGLLGDLLRDSPGVPQRGR